MLLPFLIWMSWSQARSGPAPDSASLLAFFGILAAMVLMMGLWSRLLARRGVSSELHLAVRRFNRLVMTARVFIPLWLGYGVFFLGWGWAVVQWTYPLGRLGIQVPEVFIGTLPAFLAWMGLWWAQYPADRALREQSMLVQLDHDLPVHAPPDFKGYFLSNLRLQLLFIIAPVMLILIAHDAARLLLGMIPALDRHADAIDALAMLGVSAGVFLLAPEILRRVLKTQPLVAGPLRRRLKQLCRRHGLRYRQILLWRTQHTMANAAVMGILPRFRYILLSDLLLETMTDEQIEAVFAHEAGHVIHRHMAWYVVFIAALFFVVAGPGEQLYAMLESSLPAARGVVAGVVDATLEAGRLARLDTQRQILSLVAMGAGVGAFLILFGFVSRRIERQADVFAARTIGPRPQTPTVPQRLDTPEDVRAMLDVLPGAMAMLTNQPGGGGGAAKPPVGTYGAELFASALHRVAVVNNIPTRARSWCHGSIAARMQYLRRLSADPSRSERFDRSMAAMYAMMLAILGGSIAWGLWM